MNIKKVLKNKKIWLLCLSFILVAALSVGITLGVKSCSESKSSHSTVGDFEGDGNYYLSAVDGEYSLSLSDGKFSFTIGADTKLGTYDYNGNNLELVCTDDTSASATVENDVLTLTYNGNTYIFLKKVEYTVSYNVDGTVVGTSKVLNGKTVTKPEDPAKDGCMFIGWYVDEAYTMPFGFGAVPVKGDVTLYARFAEKTVGQDEFIATYIVDGEVYSTQSTINGVLYELPTPEKEGAEFAGWWTSDDQDAAKLTCQYTDGVLKENTNLYAVWVGNAPLVSVTENSVKWNALGAGVNYTVTIYVNNSQVKSQKTTGTEYEFDFTLRGAASYKVEVSAGNETTAAYFNYKALDRVSTFTVAEPSVLIFNAVENAQKYLITVDCGNEDHVHTQLDNGKSTNFNFENCEMQEGGILFTVTAVANGYTSSVSETFSFERDLDALTGLTYNEENGLLQWNTVAKATSYEVQVRANGATTPDVYVVTEKSFSMKNYTGEIEVTVSANAKGYNVSSATLRYTSEKLVAPTGVTVKDNKIEWTKVTGAEKYNVLINGAKIGETDELSFDLPEDYQGVGMSYEISVQAVGKTEAENSYYSEAVSVKYGQLDNVVYENGLLSWSAVGGAQTYEYTVNGLGYKDFKNGETSAKVTFTQAGDNVILFKARKSNGVELGVQEIVVKAYELILDSRTTDGQTKQYVALGDTIDFPPELSYTGFEFAGWYNVPGGADTNGAKFKGNVYNDASVYALYAYWAPKEYEVTLIVNDETFGTEKVKYNRYYTLPTPEDMGNGDVFSGWASQDGQAVYTDEQGNSIDVWKVAQGMTLYAKWTKALTATKVSAANGGYGFSVSMMTGMSNFKEITVPATFTVDGETLPVVAIAAQAFENCGNLETINIPDTVERIFIGEGGMNAVGSAFSKCSNLKSIYVYETEGNHPIYFKSVDGVLLRVAQPDNEMENGTELYYFPAGRTGVYQVPNEVEYIPQKTFQSAKVTDVIIPASVTLIGKQAFENSKVTSVVFAEPISEEDVAEELELSESVFENCYALTSVDLPARLAQTDFVEKTIFGGCTSLREINIVGSDGYYTSKGGMICDSTGRQIIYCPLGKTGTLEIPATIEGIADNAFMGCTRITKVVVGANVAEIGKEAFMDCTRITTIEFKGTSTSDALEIGEKAFYGCTMLRDLTIPVNVTKVATKAFGNTPLNTRVTLNGSADIDFANGAFMNDDGVGYVTDIVIGTNIGALEISGVFSGCPIKGVTVQDGNPNYESDSNGVLYNAGKTQLLYYPNKSIANYQIPETVTVISAGVFEGLDFSDTITIGKNVTTIGDNAFKNVTGLTAVQFEKDRTSSLTIGDSAFEGCAKLETIELPETLTSIGANAFRNCSSIESLTLPSTLTKLGNDTNSSVFDGCTSLATVTVANGNDTFEAKDSILYGKEEGALAVLYFVPANLTGEVEIPSSVHTISERAFNRRNNVTKITWEGNATDNDNNLRIGDYAFAETYGLAEVRLPDGLTEIPTGLLKNSRVQKVTVPNTVNTIKLEAFFNASKLDELVFLAGNEDNTLVFEEFNKNNSDSAQSSGILYGVPLATSGLVLPERVEVIPNNYFYGSSFTSVTIPASMQRIGNGAFSTCENLSTLTFAKEPTERADLTLGFNAFISCGFTSLTVPANIVAYDGSGNTKFGDVAIHGTFMNCDSLGELKFEPGLTEIASGMFQGCQVLAFNYHITIPESVTTIGVAAFANSGLASGITIGTGVKSIGDYAFADCYHNINSGLSKIEIPANVETIGNYAFSGCKLVTNLTFAKENAQLHTIGDYAFSGCTAIGSVELPYNPDVPELKLGKSIFNGCTGLNSATVHQNVLKLNGAFSGCTVTPTYVGFEDDGNGFYLMDDGKLLLRYEVKDTTEVVIPDTVETICDSAFANTKITSVSIPDSVTVIEASAFSGCTALKTVTFGDNSGLVTVGDGAFSGCSVLESIDISQVTSLGNSAFKGCAALSSVTLNDNLKTIEGSTFENCSALTSIDLPAYLTTLGGKAFASTGLTSIALPELLVHTDMTVGEWFNNCTSLASVEVKSTNLGVLPTSAFAQCSTLESLDLSKSGITIISDSAFYQDSKLKNIIFPDELEELWGQPFFSSGLTEYDFSNTQLKRLTYATGNDYNALTFMMGTVKTLIFPETLTSFGPQILMNASGLETFIAPGLMAVPHDLCKNMTKLSYVELSPQLATIGDSAFYGCTSLTSFAFPDSLNSIGTYAFYNSGITSFSLSSGSQLETIGDYAFTGTAIAKEVYIPASLTSIGTEVFARCYNITGFRVADDNTKYTIGSYGELYDNYGTLICFPALAEVEGGVVTIEEGVQLVPYAFSSCSNITKVVLPTDMLEIPEGLFADSSISEVIISQNVQKIGDGAFDGCTKLTEFKVESGNQYFKTGEFGSLYDMDNKLLFFPAGSNGDNGVVEFKEKVYITTNNAFAGTVNVKKIVLPDTMTYIPLYLFKDSSVEEITIPASVTSLAYSSSSNKVTYAFQGCNSLKTVNFEDFENGGTAALQIWKNTFKGLPALTTVKLGNTVKEVLESAFDGCTSLKTLTLSSGLVKIDKFAFRNCTSLSETLTIPNTVTTLNESAFEGCTKLNELVFADSRSKTLSIGTKAFYNCTGLTKVTIVDWISTCGESSFEGCTSLSTVDIKGNRTKNLSIGKKAFYNCTSLSTINLVENVTSIGESAFEGCTALTGISFPSTNTSIGKRAFYGCTNLTGTIKIVKKVSSLNDSAFEGTAITAVVFEDGRTSNLTLRNYVFRDCASLTSVTLVAKTTSLGEGIFEGCTALTEITIPSAVTTIGAGAFDGCTGLTINVSCAEGAAPTGWAEGWSGNATVVYASEQTPKE